MEEKKRKPPLDVNLFLSLLIWGATVAENMPAEHFEILGEYGFVRVLCLKVLLRCWWSHSYCPI